MGYPLEVVIRRVGPADHRELARFFDDNNVVEVTTHFHPFPLSEETARYIAGANHLDAYYIALLGDQIVGLCMLRGWDEGFEIPSCGILVDHRHHGLGLGRRMTEFALAEAANLACRRVRLSVYASNLRAIGLYLSLGFGEISREPCLVAGQPDEKIIMIADLRG